MDFVAAGAQKIDAHALRPDPVLAEALNRVCVKQNRRIVLFDNLCRLGDRLNRSHFIVHIHNRYKYCLGAERIF